MYKLVLVGSAKASIRALKVASPSSLSLALWNPPNEPSA